VTIAVTPELDLDEQISLLINEDNITAARKQAEGQLSKLTNDQIKYLRKRCKLDLFFLCYSVLGYNKLSTNLHGDLAWWMMRNMLARFKMILLPRSHFKSTIETIAHPIQIALPDESGGLASWPECLGTNVRVLIGHETSEQAAKFLVSVAGHFLSNPLLMGLFPECVPSAKKQRINKHELELPRNEIWNEATFDTMGVGGKSQGRHYDYLKLDDLIGDKARDSKTEMATAKDWIDNIQAFFTEFTRGKLDIIGTRWAYDDLYAHVMLIYGPAILKYIRAAEEWDEASKSTKPIFPEAFTTESFAILKKNRKVWTAQYANDPESGANEFDKSWKRFFSWEGYNKLSAGAENNRTHYDVMDLDRCILVDPAMSGKHGFVVTGGSHDDRVFTLEAKKEEWRPNEFCDFLFSAVARWQPRVVAIEEVLFSGLYKHWFDREMQVRGIRFNIIPVPTRQKQKEARVRGLANYFGAGAIYFHESQVELIKEFDTFGATDDYHMLDAYAMGPEVWSKPFSKERWDSYAHAETELLAERDPETGY
jgi:hypothetical protein